MSTVIDIRPGEGRRFLVSSLSLFLLMTSYYVMKTVRSSKFLEHLGADYLPPFYVLIAFITLGATLFYNSLAARFDRDALIRRVYAAVIIVFSACWLLSGVTSLTVYITIAIFIIVCVYILFLTALFWSLNHDIFNSDEASRLYPFILMMGQAGMAAGGRLSGLLAKPLSTMNLIPVSLLILLLAYLFTHALQTFQSKSQGKAKKKETGSLSDLGALLRHPYARRIGILVIFSQVAITSVDLSFNKMLEAGISQPDARTEFLGTFYSYGGIGNIVLLALSSRILSWFGPVVTLFSVPVITILASLNNLRGSSLNIAAWLWIASHCSNYTLYNVGKEVLYVPTEHIVRYRFKALNDAAGYRTGDATAAIYILAYRKFVSAGVRGLGIIIFFLSFLWIPIIIKAGKAYDKARFDMENKETEDGP